MAGIVALRALAVVDDRDLGLVAVELALQLRFGGGERRHGDEKHDHKSAHENPRLAARHSSRARAGPQSLKVGSSALSLESPCRPRFSRGRHTHFQALVDYSAACAM